jgi:sugar-specific transcriptional regulator TrmB
MDIQDLLPSIIATGAVGSLWFLIRSSVKSLKAEVKEELQKVWKEFSNVKDHFMRESTHQLVCGKNALEIEKLFKKCLNETKDAIFTKLREMEKEENEKIKIVQKEMEKQINNIANHE